MPTCCSVNTVNFVNKTSTTVPYNGEFGEKPLVEVIYYVDEEWIQQGVFTDVRIQPGQIVVNHGSAATGIIKVS